MHYCERNKMTERLTPMMCHVHFVAVRDMLYMYDDVTKSIFGFLTLYEWKVNRLLGLQPLVRFVLDFEEDKLRPLILLYFVKAECLPRTYRATSRQRI